MVNAIFRWPDGKIHPYAGFGVGWSWSSLQASSDIGWVDESDNTIAWQFLAGVNFEIAPNWSAELGYRYFSCQYDVGFWDAEATNHIFSVGVNYHF
jgi:opacity protein-like surface antigen